MAKIVPNLKKVKKILTITFQSAKRDIISANDDFNEIIVAKTPSEITHCSTVAVNNCILWECKRHFWMLMIMGWNVLA